VGIDVAARAVLPRTNAWTFARVLAVPARLWLAAIIGVSCALRGIATLAHVTPYMLPDEYYYRGLAQSIATTGRPLIRGDAAHFPALLAPIVTAPFQWFQPTTAYHLTQGFNVLVMSLAAIPVYLLARRIGVGERSSLTCAAVAVASPAMLYAGFILSEPVAYPLALTAVYAGVRALDEPSFRTQVAFLTWTGLTVFTRVQYIVLVLAFAGAALCLERLRAFKTWSLVVTVVAGAGLVGLALGPERLIGVYAGGAKREWALSTLLAWFGRDVLLLAYSTGWILVPVGLVGLTCARSRVERAFAAFAALLLAGLLLEAGWIASVDSRRFEERYLMVAAPLLAASFALWARRGAPRKPVVALAAILLLGFSMRVPLSGYVAFHGKDGSPLLMGVARLEQLSSVGDASLIAALGAGALSVCLFALLYRPRVALPLGFAVVLAALTGMSTLAYSFDKVSAQRARSVALPADLQWVDDAGLSRVGLLALPGSDGSRALQQLFWNRSITDVFDLGADRIDGYAQPRASVSADGRLLVSGGTFAGPLLVQADASRATFEGASEVAAGKTFQLWKPQPNAIPRLAMLAEGLYSDGWLAGRSVVRVWPDAGGRVEGTLRLRLWRPRGTNVIAMKLRAPGYERTLRLVPGVMHDIAVAVSQPGPWTLTLTTPTPSYVDLRPVSAKAGPPVFVRTDGGRAIRGTPIA
jgi:hypothetical protein